MTKQKKSPEIVWPCGITDAARYCGMSISALKYHIYTAGDLSGRSIGHSLIFERAQLDQFLAEKRRPGRPAFAPDLVTTV
jgi:hypothetical protein